MKKIVLLLFIVANCMLGCKSDLKQKTNAIQPIDATKSASVSFTNEHFDLIYLPLKISGDSSIVGNVSKIVTQDSVFYILDRVVAQEIFAFNPDGNFKFKISAEGNNPGQYVKLQDITVYKDTLYALDPNQRKIILFSAKSGQFIKELRFGFQALSFKHIDASVFAFHIDGRDDENRRSERLLIYDIYNGMDGIKLLNEYGSTDYLRLRNDFSGDEDNHYYIQSMNDTIWEINNSNIKPLYFIILGEKNITENIKKLNFMDARMEILNEGINFLYGNFQKNENQIAVNWTNTNKEWMTVFSVDKQINLKVDVEKYGIQGALGTHQSYFVSTMIYDNYIQTSNQEKLDGLSENPVIVLFKLRE